jgi:selenoprotein W-related protein
VRTCVSHEVATGAFPPGSGRPAEFLGPRLVRPGAGPAGLTVAGRLAITYCRQCGWMLRATWMAQELLSTFAEDLGEVALIPGTGGVFTITLDGAPIWDRKAQGGFPDVRTLKQRVRDRLVPDRDLGHVDRPGSADG